MNDDSRILAVLPVLPGAISAAVKLSITNGNEFEEIRLRKNMPVAVTRKGKTLFLSASGSVEFASGNAVYCSEDELESTLLSVCENSVFAHTKEIENGYIAMPGGIRVGVSGDFSPGISGINSVNLRIPRQVKGCADELYSVFSGSMLIAGPPGCGKTTMLRELIRKLSYSGYRISVIDSRREISGGTGRFSFDLGPSADVMFLSDKARGAEMALRSMYPQVIAFDEIGNTAEVNCVAEAFHTGVYILTTAHAGTLIELKSRSVTRNLIESKILKTVVLLPPNIGGEPQIYDIEEI